MIEPPDKVGDVCKMAIYAKPAHSMQEVNSAGKQFSRIFYDGKELPAQEDIRRSIEVIDNFRASHAFPLNTFLMTLKNRANHVSRSALTAQRIKRMESIVNKLLYEREMKRKRLLKAVLTWAACLV
jgi:hypothetical protein